MRSKLLIGILSALLFLNSTVVLIPSTAGATLALSDPIYIYSNNDLVAQADLNGWPGNGTITNPFVIADMRFEDSSYTAIIISRVDMNVIIRNCTFINTTVAIEMDLSNNITITDNIITGGYEGIVIWNGSGLIIHNNTIKGVSYGLYFTETDGNIVSNNTISNIEDVGILLESSDFNTITDNDFYDSAWSGISLAASNNNTISGNYMINVDMGIYLEYKGYDNVIINNSVLRCPSEYDGITIADTPSYNTVTNNTITFVDDRSGLNNELLIGSLVVVIVILLILLLIVYSRMKKGIEPTEKP
jgi:parallel beta-helix repeat protein